MSSSNGYDLLHLLFTLWLHILRVDDDDDDDGFSTDLVPAHFILPEHRKLSSDAVVIIQALTTVSSKITVYLHFWECTPSTDGPRSCNPFYDSLFFCVQIKDDWIPIAPSECEIGQTSIIRANNGWEEKSHTYTCPFMHFLSIIWNKYVVNGKQMTSLGQRRLGTPQVPCSVIAERFK